MLLMQLTAKPFPKWKAIVTHAALLALHVLMTVQFVGCYLFLGHPYIDFVRFGHGHERLPFLKRLPPAPLFRWAHESTFILHYASRWCCESGHKLLGSLVKARIFGESLPFLACAGVLVAEEALIIATQNQRVATGPEQEDVYLVRAA
jgi:hypothetical protein